MNRILLLSIFALAAVLPSRAAAQDSINPYIIQQKCNIVLHHTDVYYNPFAPPGAMDTRSFLSCRGDIYSDPNGVGNYWGLYMPQVYDTSVIHRTSTHQYDALSNWAPYGTSIGPYTTWQRLFQADTIEAGGLAGDTVTISKNEDVDFRGTHGVWFKNGFHAEPGCFFHAYQAPKWDTAVFSDEFNDTAKFRNQWFVFKGKNGVSGWNIPQSEYDSSVYLDTDYEAHDGHALDIVFRVNLDTCSVDSMLELDGCKDSVWLDRVTRLPVIKKSITSTGYIRSCPFADSTPSQYGPLAYAHVPYGKFEIREKIPDLPHHTNNWGGGGQQLFEWDLDETDNDEMGVQNPNWGHGARFGSCHGYFKISGSDTSFISYDDTAMYSKYQPTAPADYIILNNVGYGVNSSTKNVFKPNYHGEWPLSLVNSPDTFAFFYGRWNHMNADTVTWKITKGPDGRYDLFSAPYDTVHGVSQYFTRDYQPHRITITDSIDLGGSPHQHTYRVYYWLADSNTPVNRGALYLQDTLPAGHLTTNTEPYQYWLRDAYDGFGYPVPPVLTGADTMTSYPLSDTASLSRRPYKYHTYAMEFLPNEVRILYDSIVIRRFPDRLLPPGDPCYNWVNTLGRGGINIIPGEFDADDELAAPSYFAALTQNYFLSHTGDRALGFWDKDGIHSAHHLIDYVKVWDVPKDVIVPAFPN